MPTGSLPVRPAPRQCSFSLTGKVGVCGVTHGLEHRDWRAGVVSHAFTAWSGGDASQDSRRCFRIVGDSVYVIRVFRFIFEAAAAGQVSELFRVRQFWTFYRGTTNDTLKIGKSLGMAHLGNNWLC